MRGFRLQSAKDIDDVNAYIVGSHRGGQRPGVASE
jgi:hypothetical protein